MPAPRFIFLFLAGRSTAGLKQPSGRLFVGWKFRPPLPSPTQGKGGQGGLGETGEDFPAAYLTTSTGQGALIITLSAVLPMMALLTPLCP